MSFFDNNTMPPQGANVNYYEWLHFGIKMGWVSTPYCDTHDTGWEWLTEEVKAEYDRGGDPCVLVLQILDKDDSDA